MRTSAIPVRPLEPQEQTLLKTLWKDGKLSPDFTFISHNQHDTTWHIYQRDNEYVIFWQDDPEVACQSLTVALGWITARMF